jgi:hypothetical protein
MQNKRIGLALFALGAFFVFVHTTLTFLWALAGITLDYPLTSTEGVLSILPGFTPAIGALLLVVGGLVYGLGAKEVIK